MPPPGVPPPGIPPPPPPGYSYPVQAPPTDGMAITSLVLGIIAVPGICCYGIPGILLGIAALILGRMALGRIRRSNGAVSGQGLAQAGWIIGAVAAVLSGLYLIVILAFGAFTIFGLLQATPTPTP